VISFQPGDYPILRTGDGRDVVISGHPAERGTFDMFLVAMESPGLADDPRFADVASRLRHIDDLLDEIRAWALTIPTVAEFERRVADAGLASGVLRSMDELVATDWGVARDVIVDADDRSGGSIRVPNSPWKFSASDTSTRGIPKFRGEDNHLVLADMLGMGTDEIARLDADGVLSSRLPKR